MSRPLAILVAVCMVVIGISVSVTACANDSRKGYVDPTLHISADQVEILSGVVYNYLIESGRYVPEGKTWGEAMQILHPLAPPVPTDAPWSANVKLNDVSTDSQNEVSMDVDTNGNLAAGWNDNRGGSYKCAYTSSQDGGKTWSANELYNPAGNQGGDPVVVADIDGNLYRLCMGFGGSQWVFDVSKSSDGGKTWGTWHSVNGYDKPWLAAYKGKLYITYMNSGGSIGLLRSIDDGATWLPSKSIGAQQGSCVVTDAQGNVYASWGLSTIQFSKSTDSGDTWSTAVNLGSGSSIHGSPRSASLTGCDVSPDGQNVYVSWAGDGSVDNVYVAASSDSGTTWGTAVKVNDDTGGKRNILPWIALDSKGTVHSIWISDRNGGGETFYSNSTDGGKTWTANTKVSDAPAKAWVNFIGDYNAVTVLPDGNVGAAWCDNRDGTADIFFASAPLASGGGGGQVLKRIDVTPADPTVTADQTQQFNATGYDQNNQQMTINPTWTTAGGAIDTKGLYTPNKVGKYLVTATQGSVSGSTNITVTHGVLAKIDVTPKTATITADQTQSYNATGSDAKGNPIQVSPLWSASGGTISSSGLYTPKKIGTFTITATSGTLSGTASITVTPGKLSKLDVVPKTKTITADDTQQFNATGYDAKDNPISVTVTWTVSGGSSGGSINATGFYTPSKVGTYTITATSGTLSATADIEVTPGKLASVTINPTNATLQEGQKQKFSITGAKDAKGNDILLTSLTITWGVGNASIGSILSTGEFTGIKAGSTSVTASVTDGKATKSVSAPVVVTAKPKSPLGGILGDSSMLLWLFLIILIVVIAIVVAVLIMKRRKKQAPAYPEYPYYQQSGPQPMDFQQYPQQGPPGYPDQSGYPPQQQYPPQPQYPQQYGQGGEQEPQWTKNF